MKNLALSLVTFFAFTLAANIARADVRHFVEPIIGGATIDGERLQTVLNERVDVLLGTSAVASVSVQRHGERVTIVEVLVDARRITPDDEARLRQEIAAALRLRHVVETVRFGGPKR